MQILVFVVFCFFGFMDKPQPIDPQNPLDYDIVIEGFDYYSDANRRANLRYRGTDNNIDIVATFMQEAMFNKDAVGSLGEKGLCQLLPNRTNNVRLKDERRSDGDFQAVVCLEKRNAVPNKGKIWSAYKVRYKQIPKIKFVK